MWDPGGKRHGRQHRLPMGTVPRVRVLLPLPSLLLPPVPLLSLLLLLLLRQV